MKVQQNNTIRVHYKGTLTNGQVFDSSLEREPLEFTVGDGRLLDLFESSVIGMAIDESKTIQIPAAEGYGLVNTELIQNVSKEVIPDDSEIHIGMELISKLPDGQEIPVVVTEIAKESFTIDANHPLAGEDLTFEIKIVEILKK